MKQPKKRAANDRLKSVITIRCSHAERKRLAELAKAAGLTVSTYMRASSLRKRLTAKPGYLNDLTLYQLGRLAVQLDRASEECRENGIRAPAALRDVRVLVQQHLDAMTADDSPR